MIYLLVIFMILKVGAVSWSVGHFVDQRNFKRQLEITCMFTIVTTVLSLVMYLINYPTGPDMRSTHILLTYVLLEYLLLKGHATMTYIAFIYLYGHTKQRKYKINKVERLLQGAIFATYCIVGSTGVLLLY